MRILVLNAGSSTLKVSVLDHPGYDPVFSATLEWGDDASRAANREGALGQLMKRLAVVGIPIGSLAAVGHRVVHGGERFVAPSELDDPTIAELAALAELAPLHNPVAVETIRAARAALPDVPHVAVFDTAFHAALDEAARSYALPADWVAAHAIRRYGFHGLAVAWDVGRAAELLGREARDLGLVVAHLGSGCSVTAVAGGRSAWTSMGMTPLEGLVMGTRAGSVDPGILLRLLRAGLPVEEVAEGLDHRAGLLGVSGRTADVRELLAAESAGDARAALALELFSRRAAETIAAAATALARLDGLVFSGGVGEHAGPIRERIVGRLGALRIGARLDPGADGADRVLTPAGVQPAVLRVAAREDLVIAESVARLIEA